MSLSPSTFDYLKPSDTQLQQMAHLRKATADYAGKLENNLPNGPDKTYIIRSLRSLAMWINVAITRHPDGAPR
jgi:hypothetical protein